MWPAVTHCMQSSCDISATLDHDTLLAGHTDAALVSHPPHVAAARPPVMASGMTSWVRASCPTLRSGPPLSRGTCACASLHPPPCAVSPAVRSTELHGPETGLVSCRSAGNGVEAPQLAEVDRQREAGPPAAKGSPPKAAGDDLVGPALFWHHHSAVSLGCSLGGSASVTSTQ
jgi:hypothetical protein